MCGFLTLRRKDFMTQAQATMRIHLLKLGTVKQGRAGHRGSNRRASAGLTYFTVRSEKRGLLGKIQGLAWDKLPLSIVLEFRRKVPVKKEVGGKKKGKEWQQLLSRGRAWAWDPLS